MEFYIEGEEKITYIIQRLNEVLPEGIKVLDAGKIEEKAPKLMAASNAAQVEIICEENEKKDALISGIEQILKSESCICEKKSKGKIRNFDIRPLIFDCKIEGWFSSWCWSRTGAREPLRAGCSSGSTGPRWSKKKIKWTAQF